MGFPGTFGPPHASRWSSLGEFGVRYHRDHVRKLLRACGWNLSKTYPACLATQRKRHRGVAGGKKKPILTFPAYAPEVDPDELVWRQLKHVELRNLTSYRLDQLHQRLQEATKRLRQRVAVLRNLVTHALAV